MLKLHREKFVKTTDDWYPNFPEDKVKILLSLQEMPGGYYTVMLRAWGADDFALTLDKTGLANFYVALGLYQELEKIYESVPEIVTKDWFYKRGFVQF